MVRTTGEPVPSTYSVRLGNVAQWTAQQLVEAFPWETAPRSLLRDCDAVYGVACSSRVQTMGIHEVKTAPRSPWQNPYVERLIGSLHEHPEGLNGRDRSRSMSLRCQPLTGTASSPWSCLLAHQRGASEPSCVSSGSAVRPRRSGASRRMPAAGPRASGPDGTPRMRGETARIASRRHWRSRREPRA
jgi:hypothetical protein